MLTIFSKKKNFTWFLLFLIIGIGLYALVNISRESMPEIKIPIVGVTTVYPGASSFDVENLVTEPLEKQLLRSLKSVESITSTSNEGLSMIIINFESSVDIGDAVTSVRDEVSKIKNDLPSDSIEPMVQEFSFSDQPIFVVSLSSSEAYTQLSSTVQHVEDMFLDISGVSKVQVDGIPEREITLILDKTKLSQYGLTPNFVIQKISQANFSMPAGSFVQTDIEYNLRIDNTLTHIEDIENVILLPLDQGNYVYVKDIARIEDGLAPYTSLSRLSVDGSPLQQAVTFSIYKQVDADITDVTGAAREQLHAIQEEFPDTEFITLIDYGKDINSSILELSKSALETVLLVVLVLSLGLSIRASFITAITVPLTFLITFAGLHFGGYTLNFISLFALILSIGLLVDASIVIIEGITLAKGKGMNSQEAIVWTLKEYASPVFMGNLTTIMIFIPLAFMSGIIGAFIQSIPITIIFVLIAATLIALVFVPLLTTFKKLNEIPDYRFARQLRMYRERYLEQFTVWYENTLRTLLEKRKRGKQFFWGLVILFIVSLGFVGTGLIKSEFFPPDDITQLDIHVTLPKGSLLEQSSQEVAPVESYLRGIENVSSFVTRLYPDSATITLILENKKKGNHTLTEVRKFLETLESRAHFSVSSLASGPSTGAPVSIRLTGDDYNATVNASVQIRQILEALPGTVDVDTSVSENTLDIVLTLDRGKIVDAGLDPMVIASLIRTSLFGGEAMTLKQNNEDISVVVKTAVNEDYFASSETHHISLDQLRSIPVPTSQGSVPLGMFIIESVTGNTPSIDREDGERVVTVSSYLDEGVVLSSVIASFTQAMEEVELPDSVTWSFGGDAEESAESSMQLMSALILGIGLVIGVLVFQFNSFRKMLLILSVIPLGLIGVLLSLFIFNETLSFTSMLGFVALAGIVINNSIILIDVFGKLEEDNDKKGDIELIIQGSARRLRPILLTTVTTTIGMVPLLFTSPMWRPLALAIIGGLLFATVLTLALVPLMYLWWGNKKQKQEQ